MQCLAVRLRATIARYLWLTPNATGTGSYMSGRVTAPVPANWSGRRALEPRAQSAI
jgi:hypothetical protein